MLDAPSLVEEDYRRYAAEVQLGEWEGVPGGVIEFVKSLGEGKSIGVGQVKLCGATASVLLTLVDPCIILSQAARSSDLDHTHPTGEARIRFMWSVERTRSDLEGRWDRVPELVGKRDNEVPVEQCQAGRHLQVGPV
jgi:hypothetical protein